MGSTSKFARRCLRRIQRSTRRSRGRHRAQVYRHRANIVSPWSAANTEHPALHELMPMGSGRVSEVVGPAPQDRREPSAVTRQGLNQPLAVLLAGSVGRAWPWSPRIGTGRPNQEPLNREIRRRTRRGRYLPNPAALLRLSGLSPDRSSRRVARQQPTRPVTPLPRARALAGGWTTPLAVSRSTETMSACWPDSS